MGLTPALRVTKHSLRLQLQVPRPCAPGGAPQPPSQRQFRQNGALAAAELSTNDCRIAEASNAGAGAVESMTEEHDAGTNVADLLHEQRVPTFGIRRRATGWTMCQRERVNRPTAKQSLHVRCAPHTTTGARRFPQPGCRSG